jgi:hypothetical protein
LIHSLILIGMLTNGGVQPLIADQMQLFGTMRVRSESWGWFNPAGGNYDNNYTFSHNLLRFGGKLPVAHRVSGIRPFETLVEASAPLLLGLPHQAAGPAPLGNLGMGGQYRSINGSQQGSLFIKQAYLRMPQKGKSPEIMAGRMELIDGNEAVPGDADLAYIQAQRVAQRLFSPDAFTVVGRSMDGFKLSQTNGNHVLTVAGFYPTTAAFNLDGGDAISKLRQMYFADSRSTKNTSNRFFIDSYVDARGIKAVDNTSTVTTDAIKLTTLGGHATTTSTHGKLRTDALLWGGTQQGQWGLSRQDAYAAVAEAGIKHPAFSGWWLRAGAGHFSGDTNPNDNKHQSWMPQISPPRLLFRTPVVTQSNLNDLYAMAIKRNKKETIRLEAHSYRLDKLADRWYTGGSAFQATNNFSLTGKPNGGSRNIGTAIDISYDVTLNARDTVGLYAGYVHGGDTVAATYAGRSAFLGFAQITRKF